MTGVEVEGEEEEGETGGQNEQSDDIEFAKIVLQLLHEGAVVDMLLNETLTKSLFLVHVEDSDERSAYKRCDDSKDAEAPAPTNATRCHNTVDTVTVDPGGDKPRGRSIGNEEASVLELGRVCDEDSHREVNAVVAGVEEGVCSTVGLDIVGACHDDQTKDIAGAANGEGKGTAPDVHDLGVRQLPYTGNERRDDTSQSSERVFLERTGHIGSQCAVGGRREGDEKVE